MFYDSLESLIKNTKPGLLVIDKQTAYCNRSFRLDKTTARKSFTEDLEEKVSKLDNFILQIRGKNIPIAWTRMTEDLDNSIPIVTQRMIIHNDKSISHIGSVGYQYYGLVPNSGELQIDKNVPDAFSESSLSKWLNDKGVQSLFIVGGFASRCVFASAIGAQNNGFNPILLTDLLISPIEFQDEVSVTNGIIHDVVGYTMLSTDLIL